MEGMPFKQESRETANEDTMQMCYQGSGTANDSDRGGVSQSQPGVNSDETQATLHGPTHCSQPETPDDHQVSSVGSADCSSEAPRQAELRQPISAGQEELNPSEDSDDEPELEDRVRIYIAVDLGTTNSGFAFVIGKHSDRYYVQPNELDSNKTPTVLLLNNDESKTLHSFGKAAWDHYQSLEKEKKKEYYLFYRFKMALHRDKIVHADMPIKATDRDESLPAKLVFRRTMEYFLQLTDTEIVNRLGMSKWQDNDVTWLLTVPAIWGDRAKELMRQAALKAGMVPPGSRNKLVIELEPEGAALLCRTDLFHVWRELGKPPTLRYTVLDCGGGTVDVTVHDLNMKSLTVEEAHPPTGGAWGGTTVDGRIVGLFKRFVGDNVADHLPEGVWSELIFESIEDAKRSVQLYSTHVLFKNLSSFHDRIESKGGNLARSTKGIDGVKVRSGNLRVEVSLIEECFRQSLDQITSHVRKLMEEVKGVHCILLVGGYSDSPFLVRRIKEEFSDAIPGSKDQPRCRVISPDRGGQAILKGALIYGQRPRVIKTRISRFAYGFSATVTFRPEVHDIQRMVRLDRNRPMQVQNAFSKVVEVNQRITIDSLYTKTYRPTLDEQEKLELTLYRSACPNVLYIDDDSCEELVAITVPLEPVRGKTIGRFRPVTLKIDFSDTIIHITVKDEHSGRIMNRQAEFVPAVNIDTAH